MSNEKLETKVDKILFSSMIQPGGISSNGLGYAIQNAVKEFQKNYGKGNVWYDDKAIYIQTQINTQTGGK